jgi:hypothetical protein
MGEALLTVNVAMIFICFSVCLTPIKLWYQLWQNHLRNEGFVSQDHIEGFSAKQEYKKHITYSIQYHIYEIQVELLHISAMY